MVATRTPMLLMLLTLAVLPVTAGAQGFAAVVSPPRFEIATRPGEVSRQVVEITNADSRPATYRIRTADWTIAADGSVTFAEDLTPGSCRPWVAIEQREIKLPGGGRYRFRFEVQPPAGEPAGECRFALLIEGEEQAVRTAGGLDVPVAGRIGVIVYASVGGTLPDLHITSASVEEVNGRSMPVLRVANTGNAHGRLSGYLDGVDASGRRLEFTPSTLPILPGETRAIPLTASVGDTEVADIAYPVRIRGELEWGDRSRIKFDQLFER